MFMKGTNSLTYMIYEQTQIACRLSFHLLNGKNFILVERMIQGKKKLLSGVDVGNQSGKELLNE